MDIAIYLLSTAALLFGIVYGITHRNYRGLLYGFAGFVLLGIIVNGVDVFLDGNLTTQRQIVYLCEAVVVCYFAIRR